ncbi:glutaredoxin [Biomphalaria glabrata]|uniref:Uncharacterized monothiol glutaredoxin F10D7.3-like n=1 Tax=Biomphalaria glabrata TaxID=6526 RepID=A0A9U8E123_BIOGL|nr:uncharacterized monothiol glutaredoxin F10D7.3-like [Biomphalaria glabrata]KAI8742721.1 glutaredoxin-1-like protein [Biomphalaria glabrata]
MAGAIPFVDYKIKQRKVLLFSKTFSPESSMVKSILSQYSLSDKDYEIVEIEKRQDCVQIENYFQFLCLDDSRAVPQLFIDGHYIGGAKQINLLQKSGELKRILKEAHAMD